MKTKKCCKDYSIWIIPDGEIYRRLFEIINSLSHQYSCPSFKPHITLIKDLSGKKEEIISKSFELASRLDPYNMRINDTIYFNKYFRSLFLKIKRTNEIMDANLIAKEIFNCNEDSGYIPHLTLMYENSSLGIKEKIALRIGKDLEFKVGKIHLFSTAGKIEDWCETKEFDLK